MLERFFDSSARGLARVRSLRNGLHGSQLDSFAKQLFHSHYAITRAQTPSIGRALRLVGQQQPHPVKARKLASRKKDG
jgi:hypothetical protein